MKLFKGQYTLSLKTAPLESGFSTKEVFLAGNTLWRLSSAIWENYLYQHYPMPFQTLHVQVGHFVLKNVLVHVCSGDARANLKSTVVTLAMANSGCIFNLVTCYMHHLLQPNWVIIVCTSPESIERAQELVKISYFWERILILVRDIFKIKWNRSFFHHNQGSIHFNTAKTTCPAGMYFLVHS